MNVLSTQSNAIPITTVFIGTSSLLPYFGQSGTTMLVPSKSYKYKFVQKEESVSYLLKHEVMPATFENTDIEPLIDMPIIKKIRVKFNRPMHLEFHSVEDNKGFIG
jgi:hypothetical protein